MENIIKRVLRYSIFGIFYLGFILLTLPMLPIYWLVSDMTLKEVWLDWASIFKNDF